MHAVAFLVHAALALASTAADRTPQFMSFLTSAPPALGAATALCERGLLPARSEPLVLAPPAAAAGPKAHLGAAPRELSEFLVALLPRWPDAIALLACAVQKGLVPVATLPDGGASLLAVASARKHLRLTAALLKAGASLRHVAPRESGGGGVLHTALSSSLLSLDISAKVIREAGAGAATNPPPPAAAAAAAAGSAPTGSSSAGASPSDSTGDSGSGVVPGSISAWLGSVGRSIERHLEAVSVGEAASVGAAVDALLRVASAPNSSSSSSSSGSSSGPGAHSNPPPGSPRVHPTDGVSVLASDAHTVANGLSSLLLRLLLTSAAAGGTEATGPHNAARSRGRDHREDVVDVSLSSGGTLQAVGAESAVDGSDCASHEQHTASCSHVARALSLQGAWVSAPVKPLVLTTDRYGRSPLHTAAASGNALSLSLLAGALFSTVHAESIAATSQGDRQQQQQQKKNHRSSGALALGHPLSLDGGCTGRWPGGSAASNPGTSSLLAALAGVAPTALVTPTQRASLATLQFLSLRDSLGADALDIACAHGNDGVAAALSELIAGHALNLRSLGVNASSFLEGIDGGAGPMPGVAASVVDTLGRQRPSACAPTLVRLALGGGAGGGAAAAGAGVTPWKGEGRDGRGRGGGSGAARNSEDTGGWTPVPSNLPKSAKDAVRLVLQRLADRLAGHRVSDVHTGDANSQDSRPAHPAVSERSAEGPHATSTTSGKPRARPGISSRAAKRAFAAHCDADVVDFSTYTPLSGGRPPLTAHDFLLRFLHARRPVLLRGIGRDWAVRADWTRDGIEHGVPGTVEFTASRIPYAKAFHGPGGGDIDLATTEPQKKKEEKKRGGKKGWDVSTASPGSTGAFAAAGVGTPAGSGHATRVTLSDYVRAMMTCGTPAAARAQQDVSGALPAASGAGSHATPHRVDAESTAEASSLMAPADAALCERLGYRASDMVAAAAAQAPQGSNGDAELPLYVFDTPFSGPPAPLALGGRGTPSPLDPWAAQPTPPAPVRCATTGCGKSLNAAMQAGWYGDVAGSSVLASTDFQISVLNGAVPVDEHSPALFSRSVLVEAARLARAGGCSSVNASGGHACREDAASASTENDGAFLRHGHAGEEEGHAFPAGSYEAHEHDHLILTSPLPRPQFFLGPPGSGAPMHFHKDATNFLAWGQKRWFLLPPRTAVYSTVPIARWVTTELQRWDGCLNGRGNSSNESPGAAAAAAASGSREPPQGVHDENDSGCAGVPAMAPLECTQNAGDVMFVPAGWGHAVLNTATSVGLAVEFSSPLSRGY